MDSVSLPVVSATTPPPPRAASSKNAGPAPAASPARGSRADGGRPTGPHASGESRNFDDVLSDVHAAKDDKTSVRTTLKTDEDKGDATAAPQSDAGQTQTAAVVVAPVPVALPDATPKAAEPHVGGTAGREHRDRSVKAAPAEIATSCESSAASAATVAAVVAPVAVPQTPSAKTADTSGKVAASDSDQKKTAASGPPLSSAPTRSAHHKKLPTTGNAPAAAAVTTEPFGPQLDPQESAEIAPELAELKRESDTVQQAGLVSSPDRRAAVAGEPVPPKGSSSNDVPQSELKEKVPSQAPELPTRETPAELSGSPVAPAAPANRDAVTHTAPSAIRRAASRAAAQTVIGKVMQREGTSAEAPATASADPVVSDATAQAAQRSVADAPAAQGVAKPSVKLTVPQPQAADAISVSAAATSGRPDAAGGERRNTGQGGDGQEPGTHAKQLLVSAATGGVVVAPQDVRQAFERMVREVTAPTSTLDASSGAAVNDQIVRGMQLQMKGNVGEARITLAPEHLGEVVVEMRVEKDAVVATLRADTPAVRGWLATHQDDLRAGLADVGLRLDDLQVSERDSQRERHQPPADQQPQTPRRARRTSTGELPRFEVEA